MIQVRACLDIGILPPILGRGADGKQEECVYVGAGMGGVYQLYLQVLEDGEEFWRISRVDVGITAQTNVLGCGQRDEQVGMH